ncbi:MAG TPA: glycosyltransferase family 39 protein [Candidatus Acidoferrum sp.]|nr:glycosyltransferase family 39 protein [Candidatus Acidoferrum sp.]
MSLSTVLLNAFILFVLIPKVSAHISGLYSQNYYADGYDQLAANLAAGNGYRFYPDTAQTLMREPGYPVLLAGIYKLFGSNFEIVKLMNMIMAFGAAYVMTLIGREISTNPLLIYGAPLLFLFHPETLMAESRGGVEVLFGFILVLYISTVYRMLRTDRWLAYVLSGAVLGITLLVRSTPILFPAVLFGYFLFVRRQSKSSFFLVRNFTLKIVTTCLVISPWIVRNYLLTEKVVPTASVLGVAAQTGLYLATHHEIGNVGVDWEAAMERNRLAQELGYPFRAGYYQYFYSPADELAFSQYLSRRVANEYKASPFLFAKTMSLNLIKFWCGGKTGKSVALDATIQFPFLALAISAVVLCIKGGRAKIVAPLALLCVYIVGVSIPILAQARYAAPLIPFMSILGVITLLALKQRLGKRDYALSEIVL